MLLPLEKTRFVAEVLDVVDRPLWLVVGFADKLHLHDQKISNADIIVAFKNMRHVPSECSRQDHDRKPHLEDLYRKKLVHMLVQMLISSELLLLCRCRVAVPECCITLQ